jgi:GWxTD domain-containing protein
VIVMMRNWNCYWRVALLALLSLVPTAAWSAREPALPPRYAHWLHDEVEYTITNDERSLFLKLNTDQERDRFIDTFWQARNPDPNAPTNAVKEAYYERLEYANAHFGYGSSSKGSHSDRGMVYITLGAPQQRRSYVEKGELKPIEIWFYQNLSGALPPHFYVMFYKQSAAEDYELYSPYGDRPQRLINSSNAINNDPVAVKLIQRDIDDEAATAAISLIPGEPVDFKDPAPSLQSDILLNDIRNYRNLPQIRDQLAAGHALEGVSHRLVLGEQFSDLAVIATRDPDRQSSIHYLLRLLRPEEFSLAEQSGGRYYYSLEVETKLTGEDGRVVSERTQSLSDFVGTKALPGLQGKCFGIEGRIPAAPGKYDLSLTLTNVVTKQAFRQTRPVLVPEYGDRIGISQLFFANSLPPLRSIDAQDPFSFSGVRLKPIGSNNAAVQQGDPLRVIFQIWAPSGSPQALHGKKIQIHYLIGKVNTQSRIEEDQEVDRGSFSEDGNLLMGKDLRIDALYAGFYRLVVKVTDPESGSTAYQSVNFEVADGSAPVASLWTVDVPWTKQTQ